MELVKLKNKNCIVRVCNLEFIWAVNQGITLVNSEGWKYEIFYGSTGGQVADRDQDFNQLLKLLVKENT